MPQRGAPASEAPTAILPSGHAAVRQAFAALRPALLERYQEAWGMPELPAMEARSSGLLIDWLAGHGFTIERQPGGVPTAFVATRYLGPGPKVAILAEYDALPGLANDAVPRRSPLPLSAGHACGHNHIGPGNSAAAMAAVAAAERLGLTGAISVVGCPAEEIVWGKVALLAKGVFAPYDVVLTSHGDYQSGALSRPCQSVKSGEMVFTGKAGHGGQVSSTNALDAAELAIQSIERLRASQFADVGVRHVLRTAGRMPSITPDEVRVWLTARHVDFERLETVYGRIVEICAGAAAMSGLAVRHQPIAGSRGYLANDVLAGLLMECLRLVGPPSWTPEEEAFMAELSQAVAPGEVMRLDRGLALYDTGHDYYGQDDGEVSWRIPLGRVNWAYPEQVTVHHWAWTAMSGHMAGHRGALMAAEALALAAVGLLERPATVAAAKAELAGRVGGRDLGPPRLGAWRTLTTAPETFWDATWVE